ncbi:unnamed protein product [Allacma fusca]|uniref:CRAL-TRIO domain-containing protein n=1 Tax=Allacma fusca TaxID=39272 RepID=A0A8J2NXS5_9HEXA|nr:unnamed protein product [Allacma fusca]
MSQLFRATFPSIFFLWALAGLLLNVQCQILPEEVPRELQHLLNWDLDTWKPPEEIRKNFPYYLSGFDEENRPIWVMEFGKWDIRSMLEKGPEWEKALDKHVDQLLWNFYNSSGIRSTHDFPVKEIETLVDAEGYQMRQLTHAPTVAFTIRKLRLIVIAMTFAHKVYFVNTSYIGERFLNIMRPVLGKEFEKFDIYGTNPKQWIPKLLKIIPRDQLPPWYGGKPDFKPLKVYG